uniref:BTB domain-containing protein n=1 Tax=Timema genevievae TaxID=629358 RepID=A0A7R9PK55_TIMGE|nr:unnamed protein product [Timema genevievae]
MQEPSILGPSREQELIISGASIDQELTVQGPSREQEFTLPGPSRDQESTILGPSRDQELTVQECKSLPSQGLQVSKSLPSQDLQESKSLPSQGKGIKESKSVPSQDLQEIKSFPAKGRQESKDYHQEQDSDVIKLQLHLSLLKDEYVKLQNYCSDLERKYSLAIATHGEINENGFIPKLLQIVGGLFNQDLYSDIKVKLDGQLISAHRFVLSARSESWGVTSLSHADLLDWSMLSPDVGRAVLKWAYTDEVDFFDGDKFTLDLMCTANEFKLDELVSKCEKVLIASANIKNCISLYTTACQMGANFLKEHCSGLISAHWITDITNIKTCLSEASIRGMQSTKDGLIHYNYQCNGAHKLYLAGLEEKRIEAEQWKTEDAKEKVGNEECRKKIAKETKKEIGGVDNRKCSSERRRMEEIKGGRVNDFTPADFSSMNSALLFDVLKSQTNFPLHSAIRLHRDDVVFLYLIAFNNEETRIALKGVF